MFVVVHHPTSGTVLIAPHPYEPPPLWASKDPKDICTVSGPMTREEVEEFVYMIRNSLPMEEEELNSHIRDKTIEDFAGLGIDNP